MSKPHIAALKIVGAGLGVYAFTAITSQFSEPILGWALKKYNAKSETKIKVDSIKGGLFFNRELYFDNVRIEGPNIQFGCENAVIISSLWGLLRKKIKVFEISNAQGKVVLNGNKKKKRNWEIGELSLLNVNVDVSTEDEKLHSVNILNFNGKKISKDNLNSLFQSNGKGHINGSPFYLQYMTHNHPLYIYAKRDIQIPLDLLNRISNWDILRSGSMRFMSTIATTSDFTKEYKYKVELKDVEISHNKYFAPAIKMLNEKKNVDLEFDVVRSEEEVKTFANEEAKEFAHLLLKGLLEALHIKLVGQDKEN